MKRALRFVECRQLPIQERISIQSLYSMSKTPPLLSLPSHQYVYVALNKCIPLAAFVANDEHLDAFHIIQLSNATYTDRHVFRGLLDRIMYERSRETTHPITYYIQEEDYHNQDKRRMYEASGFQVFHQTHTYRLPLIPCEKASHTYWTLELMDYSRRADWLFIRNAHCHVLPGAIPMTDEQFAHEVRHQTLFYTLNWCDQSIGIMKVRLHMYHITVQEIQLDCEESVLREALSFLQQKLYYTFRYIEEVHISTTNLQSDLNFALRKQGAQISSGGMCTLTQQVLPTPLY